MDLKELREKGRGEDGVVFLEMIFFFVEVLFGNVYESRGAGAKWASSSVGVCIANHHVKMLEHIT